MPCLSAEELTALGFRKLGNNVRISSKASFYNAHYMEIGDCTRIDDFCVLSAGPSGISIGAHVHIAVFSSLIGRGAIVLDDYVNISSRVAIYSSTDDFSGEFMSNPTIDARFTRVRDADVTLRRHVIVGCGSVILPGVELEEGCAIGALSLVSSSCQAFSIYAGVPVRRLRERSRRLLTLEQEFVDSKKAEPA